MDQNNSPVTPSQEFERLELDIQKLASSIQESDTTVLVDQLYEYLQDASQLEHLLAMQYLYAAFSMKKYPQEFVDYASSSQEIREKRLAQLEMIRRWEAEILFVSRQEMEHLNLVQNLIVILGKPIYLYRPNFPVPSEESLLQKAINLMPFSQGAISVFRYWEKPDNVHLSDPFDMEDVPEGIKNFGQSKPHPDQATAHDQDECRRAAFNQIEQIVYTGKIEESSYEIDSIEKLYDFIWIYFAVLFELRLIDGQNLTKVSEEHFGFNIALDPIVDGKYFNYVDTVIAQIIEEGEGVTISDPNLQDLCTEDSLMGSHFCVFSNLLKEIQAAEANNGGLPFAPALPVVWNPTISGEADHHKASLPEGEFDPSIHALTPITNPIGIKAMSLFNQAYDVLVRMLNGYFTDYSIDYTTGIRPPETNAFFRTSFYPFMTMVIRPLGEILCRLPSDINYTPVPGQIPGSTCGPNYFYNIPQTKDLQAELDSTMVYSNFEDFISVFKSMSKICIELAEDCRSANYHIANYQEQDARDFDTRFDYLSQNLSRIAQNFEAYWNQTMIAPIPSKGFQNFNNSYN